MTEIWTAAGAEDTVAFSIEDRRITESSGLARDEANGLYWTVNDSGDGGIAYALDDRGRTEGTLEFRVDPVDVEAVAFHQGRLYVADIGDNRARRDNVTVYFFDDAAPAADRVPPEEEASAAERAVEDVPETVPDAYQQAAQAGARAEGEGPT